MKRIISVGLSKPSNLEEDIIYVSLESFIKGEIRVKAVSNEDFEYDYNELDGIHLHRSGKLVSNLRGSKYGSWLYPYKEFLDNLVENNDGILDYDRLVKESERLASKCRELAKIVSEQNL